MMRARPLRQQEQPGDTEPLASGFEFVLTSPSHPLQLWSLGQVTQPPRVSFSQGASLEVDNALGASALLSGKNSKNRRTGWQFFKILNIELPYDQQFHFWVCTWRNRGQGLEEIFAHPRSQLHLHIPHSPKLGTTQAADNKRMEKQNVVYAYNRKYSASRRKEILTCAIKWRNLEETILSEISQSQKDKDCMIPPMKRYLE